MAFGAAAFDHLTMNLLRLVPTAIAAVAFLITNAQAVLEPPMRTIKGDKLEVTCLAMAPKGDRVLVGTSKGAYLHDLETGKKLLTFPFNEDGSTTVYSVAFNDNGEYVVLIGFSGKRAVFDVKTGKQDKDLMNHRWIPDPRALKTMGLAMGNSAFDRFYQQSEATHNGIRAKADKNGAVSFTDAGGAEVQRLTYAENKDQHHRAPCLFTDTQFVTGTDDGRVLFYDLR
jgi:WD40 repeat protein